MTLVKGAMNASKQQSRALTRLLAATSIVLSQQLTTTMNQEFCQEWSQDCFQIAMGAQDDTCVLNFLKCLENMCAQYFPFASNTEILKNALIRSLEHESPAIRTQVSQYFAKN